MSVTRARVMGFLSAYALLVAVSVFAVDLPVSLYFRTLDETHHALIDAFRAFTDLGKSKWYLWPSGAALFALAFLVRTGRLTLTERWRQGTEGMLGFFLNIAISGLVTDFFKPLIGQARPVAWLRDGVYGFRPFSFNAAWNAMPSGHATTAFSLALVLSAFFPRWRVIWWGLALLLAASRVVVNAHYVSDIVAAAGVAAMIFALLRQPLARNRIKTLHDSIFPIDGRRPTL